MGGGAPGAGAAPAGEAQEEKKEEVKKEKSHYDIELTSFAAASKVKIIKEVRQILGLGLKESKDLVESAPIWIKKEVKKDDADKIIKTLTELGGELRMA
jgi:large subunit ribosomal protein L7/L12